MEDKVRNRELSKRIGRVKIDVKMLRELNKEVLFNIFSKFYPLRVNDDFNFKLCDYISEYTGLSPEFDEIESGTLIPFYFMYINSEDNSVEFVKEKNK